MGFNPEFIFTLAMALKCYPLQPGGLLAIEAIALGMASPDSVYHEVEANLQVILLLMFMVAGIYFMRDMLLFVFTKILISVKSKMLLSFLLVSLCCVSISISGRTHGDGGFDYYLSGFLLGLSQSGIRKRIFR